MQKKLNKNSDNVLRHFCMTTLGHNYSIDDLIAMRVIHMIRSVDLSQSDNAANEEESVLENDNSNGESTTKDAAVGSDAFDPLFCDALILALEHLANHR